MPETFTLVTDGACSGNGTDDARGGWAAILIGADGAETILTGGEFPTTNNRMELIAALEGLQAAPEGSEVDLVTDSSYLANAIGKGWLDGWSARAGAPRPAAGGEPGPLGADDHRARAPPQVRPVLVPGHAGHPPKRAGRPARPGRRQGRRAAAGHPPDCPRALGLDVGGRPAPAAPRTLVVGPGAIGGFVAARLTEAGWPVTVVARGGPSRRCARARCGSWTTASEREVRLAVAEARPRRPRSTWPSCA